MNTKVERLKEIKNNIKENIKDNAVVNHVKANQNVYILVGAIAGTLVASNYYYTAKIDAGTVTNTVTAGDVGGDLTIAGRDVINNFHAPKRLSYIVSDGERYWDTQASAAKELGDTAVNVSRHLNHGADLPSGAKLTRKGVRS